MALEEFIADGIIDGARNGALVVEQGIEQLGGDGVPGELLVECLRSLVEDDAKEAVVDLVVVGSVGLLQIADIEIEEAQLAAQVAVDGRRADACLGGEALV